MYYVYLIESTAFPGERYVGITANLKRRFRNHNDGGSPHTVQALAPRHIRRLFQPTEGRIF